MHRYNPQWKPNEDPEVVIPPLQNKMTALPVVANPLDKESNYFPEDEEIVVDPSYQEATIAYAELVQEEEIVVGGEEDVLVELTKIFAKYEVPAGMLGKLLLMKSFSVGEVVVDDSASMNAFTDAKGPNGEVITRWQEAKFNLFRMVEVMAYVVAPPFHVRFLNKPITVLLERQKGESPEAFVVRAKNELETAFTKKPSGSTPALEAIQDSLNRYKSLRTLRYFVGDGVPNGGQASCSRIKSILTNRANPQDNPFTFISCTNQDEAVEWMKECEEVAPYCSEFDDFSDESREILKDQGKAFPYSFGLHLVGQLIAAVCPHDLDAMDESVPFAKSTLESLLGYTMRPEEYKYYFDSFLEAQRNLLRYAGYGQTIQKSFALDKLPQLYPQFVTTGLAGDIPEVQEYKASLKALKTASTQRSAASPPQDECCTIL